ncbi:hypothetical protein [Erythrobacter sp.]|nr:hypothetical protein [Erythrobacter sp.]MBO6525998.1 hypothetical protein [Erythrobacter sp.]MBO6530653.1 hypothetical protein [Erythrobacter sp.]
MRDKTSQYRDTFLSLGARAAATAVAFRIGSVFGLPSFEIPIRNVS